MDTGLARRDHADLDIDDKDYLVKLLSLLPIVKWQAPQKLGPVKRGKTGLEERLDYSTLPQMDFQGGLHMQYAHPPFPDSCGISRYSLQILQLIFPPHEWIQHGDKFFQQISRAPATRLETAQLNDGIKALMIQAQARVTGLCPIRENLVLRCFDEMIRLATVDSGERGLLMRTVRDEIRMTLTCYKTLVEFAIEFGSRKFGVARHALEKMNKELARLKSEKLHYQYENQEMRIKMKLMDRQNTDERLAVLEFRKNKLAALKRTNDQFIAMLDQVGADKNSYRHLL